MNGVVFYQGKSRIDGCPIVAIATVGTKNPKTGDLVQTWILRQDCSPIEAIWSGEDASVCGDCPLRGDSGKSRGCYVTVHQAPLAVWRAWKAGSYEKLGPEHARLLQRAGLRLGSYGDPVAVPMRYWKRLAKLCGQCVPGYTHQWRERRFQRWSKHLMASTHSLSENALAAKLGWRTFRTVASKGQLAANEILCPASIEGGQKATCATCGACNGRRDLVDLRKSVAIVAHGSGGKIEIVNKLHGD